MAATDTDRRQRARQTDHATEKRAGIGGIAQIMRLSEVTVEI